MKRELNLLKTENVEPNEIQNKYLKLILFHKDYLDKNTNYFYFRQRVIEIHFCIIFYTGKQSSLYTILHIYSHFFKFIVNDIYSHF